MVERTFSITMSLTSFFQAVGAGLAIFATGGWAILGYALLIGGGVYGAAQAKKAAAADREKARIAYNNSLQDRTATRVVTDADYRYVYGRARVGSDVVAIFTSGAKDEFKWLVCVHAAHECDAVEDIYISGKKIGTLDGSGFVTSGSPYFNSGVTASIFDEPHAGTPFTLAHVPVANSLRVLQYIPSSSEWVQIRDSLFTLSGADVTVLPPVTPPYRASYEYFSGQAYVRVITHLGGATDPADAVLVAATSTLADKWLSTSVLRGFCYSVVMLDLNNQEFQGGIPSIEVVLRGKKLHDPRDGAYPNDTAVWSQNPALVIADYLTSEMCSVPVADLPLADYQAAANVCAAITGCTYSQAGFTVTVTKTAHGLVVDDVREMEILTGTAVTGHYTILTATADTFTYTAATSLTTSGNVTVAGLYTINGTVSSNQDADKTLEFLAQAMAGFIVKTSWKVMAGKYVAPVMTLDQSDIVGSLSVITGTSDADIYNGVKGQYVGSENSYVVTDFKPYQNLTYVAADAVAPATSRELWTGIDFSFTDQQQRVHNLCRIFTEDQRNGFTINAAFSLKTWALKIGDRVSFTSTFLGQVAKVYRVTDKRFSPEQAIELTLKEDAASIWDTSDATVVDSTPNTNMPDPFAVGLCGALAMTELIYETTGSAGVKTKATLTWTAPADVSVRDYDVEYKKQTGSAWIKLPNVSGTLAEFFDMTPDKYDFRVRARNNMFVYGNFSEIFQFEIIGLLAPPGNVTNFSVRSMAGLGLATWDRTVDLDVKIGGDVIIRHSSVTVGATWEAATILPDGEMNGDAMTAIVPLATGTYFAKFKDSVGKLSVTPASFVMTEAILTGFTTVTASTQHTLFSGVKTNCVATGGLLKLDSVTLVDSILIPIDEWDFLDNIGGIQPLGVYEFDAILDLTTVASRRFHAKIVSLGYNASDLIDDRLDLIDSWADFVGGVIDDTNATVYAAVSDDNVTYSGWSPFMVADYNCRYAKFKAELVSGDATHNIQVSELSVTVKVPA